MQDESFRYSARPFMPATKEVTGEKLERRGA